MVSSRLFPTDDSPKTRSMAHSDGWTRRLSQRRAPVGRLALVLVLVWGLGAIAPPAAAGRVAGPFQADSLNTVSAVRVDADEDGVPDRRGDTVTVAGRSVVASGTFAGDGRLSLQDGTAGIHVTVPATLDVERGDSLRIRGVVRHENGLTQLQALQSTVVSDSLRVPSPVPLTVPAARGEAYEGAFVHIRARVVRTGTNDGGKYLLLQDRDASSSAQLSVFVPNQRLSQVNPDRFEAGDQISVTGVLGQHDYTAPYTDFYQVTPREVSDLAVINQTSTYLWMALYILLAGGLLAVGGMVVLRLAVKRRTRELEESKARFRRLAEATVEGILLHDEEHVLDVNQAFADMVGRRREALLGRSVTAVLEETTRNRSDAASGALGDGVTEAEVVAEAGHPRPVEIEARTVEAGERAVQVVALRDISKRKEWERELLRAKDEAEQVAQLKSNLLNNMSHELRTPITSIIGYAELIMDEPDGAHETYAARIRRGGERLFETLQSVLEMSQLEAGALEPDPRAVDMEAVVQEVVDAHEWKMNDKNLAVEVEVPSPCMFFTDRRLVYRILNNLVHNAVKFTEDGGVQVGIEKTEGRLWMTVTDTGVGIDADFQEHLFDPFRQGMGGRERAYEGTGLGLALTKRLVTLLGGTIDVDSTKGDGSTFVVSLPSLTTGETDPERLDERADAESLAGH